MSDKNTRLVWSDDPRDQKSLQSKSEADPPPAHKTGWIAVFRIEKGGRGGKTVTVLDQLPKSEEFLKALCKELKSKCGSGGTYSAAQGSIEIQGDQRVAIKAIFDKKGLRYKGM